MMGVSYIKVFFDFEERTEELTDAEKSRLLLAMLRYAQTGEKPVLSGNERYIWPVFKGEIDRQMAVYNTKLENGSRGGRPKKSETETENNRNKPDETENNRNKTENNRNAQEQEQEQEQEQDQERETRARAQEEAGRIEAGFEQFWKIYPRKEDKKRAKRIWTKLRPDDGTVAEILEAVRRQSGSDQWTRDGGAYIPHPSSWLNGERWKDETVPAAGGRPVVVAQRYGQRDYSGEQEEAMRRMVGMA